MTTILCAGIAIVLSTGPQATDRKPFTETLPKSTAKVNMVPIPGGSLTVRGEKLEVKPVYMAATETTWEMFDAFLASGPASKPYDQTAYTADAIARPSKSYILPDLGWGHRGFPAINISQTNAEMFCRWMSSVTGKKYRLPTEAEWEWACRAGIMEWRVDAPTIAKMSWNAGNSEGTTKPVGKKEANAYGLFDMLGNAGEWAIDSKGEAVLCGATFLDPASAAVPTHRKRYSPDWQVSDPQVPKSRWWLSDGSFVGFRVVCEG